MAHSVKVFSEEGVPLYDIGEFEGPASLAIDKFDQLIVCDAVKSSVQILTLDGKVVGWLVRELGICPCSVAVTRNGGALVSDVNKNRIYVFQ